MGLFIISVNNQEAAHAFAQQAVFDSWRSAADNVTKAAELLHLFVDDSIDDNQPFATVRQQALSVMNNQDIETLCLYLKKQKTHGRRISMAIL